MADDYQDTYRARIEFQQRQWNPEYDWNRPTSADNPRFLEPREDANSYVVCYGPYANKGTAKAMMTRESNIPRYKVISAKVQKASITWEDVDE
jgi:hypothetical protein